VKAGSRRAIYLFKEEQTMELSELSEYEVETVSGGLNDWVAGGATIIGIGAVSATTLAFAVPIGVAMIGLGAYGTWKKTVSH
jgi:hypothetical protein